MTAPLRSLLFSTLYPSSNRPRHGLFVETRLRKLLESGQVDAKVVAPVPWFFSSHPRFGRYGQFARTPLRETHHGIDVLHPRYLLPPKVGMSIAPFALAMGAIPAIRRLIDDGFDFDLVDAHYYYPDGVAAAIIARHFGKPFAVTARGSDLNVLPNYRLPRHLMQWAAHRATASIGVSSSLVDALRQWQIDPKRLHVMRNGVDLALFHPQPRNIARQQLGLSQEGPVILSVGNLVDLKGHHLIVEAMPTVLATHAKARLVIVGDGPERDRLRRATSRLNLSAEQVALKGSLSQEELVRWYNAADMLVLASRSEGCANVLLESMACGTPVVATDVGGSGELVDDSVGMLIGRREPEAFATAIRTVIERPPDRNRIRAHAERFGWQQTTDAQLTMFRQMATVGAAPC